MEENEENQVINTDNTTETSSYTPYELINFENGTLVTPGTYNSETGELTMPIYSGKAPMNAANLNHLEQGLKNLENHVFEKDNEIKGSLDNIYEKLPGQITTNDFPVLTGYKIDGKDVYVIRVKFDAPSSADNLTVNKELSMSISNIIITSITGIMYAKNGKNYISIPDPGSVGANNSVRLSINEATNGKANLSIIFGQPRSEYTVEASVYFIYR